MGPVPRRWSRPSALAVLVPEPPPARKRLGERSAADVVLRPLRRRLEQRVLRLHGAVPEQVLAPREEPDAVAAHVRVVVADRLADPALAVLDLCGAIDDPA